MAAFFASLFGSDKSKTFKPLSGHKNDGRAKLHEVCQATLGTGDMKSAVCLPAGEDLNEWLGTSHVAA
jgi:MOB kinase activator 1